MPSTNFPVRVVTKVTENNVSLVVQLHANRLLVFVREVDSGGAGTLVEFRKEGTQENSDSSAELESIFDIRVLFGIEKPEILLAARVLGAKLYVERVTSVPILFGFAIKRFEKSLLNEIGENLVSIIKTL